MKKLIVTAITIISMSLAFYSGNCNASNVIANNDINVTIEKAKPHTKQYNDIKTILDEFEQAIKNAKTCEDLENASMSFIFQLLSMVEVEYEDGEELTEAEDKELSNMMDALSNKVEKLQKQWGCETEEEESTEVVSTTTEDWDDIINDYEALANKLEKMKGLDFDDEKNLGKLLEFVSEAQPLLERIETADSDALTEKQAARLERVSDRFTRIAKEIGLIDD